MSSFLIETFFNASAVKLIVSNLLSVTYLGFAGSLLQIFHKEHCFEKRKLKNSAFPLKPVIIRFS